jgi:DHA3 family macrolide efflux protein-like MFS transporter
MLADMRQGFRFIWNWKALLAFAGVGVMIYMFGQAAASLLPILVTRRFHGGPFQFGWLQSAGGIGAVIGGVTLGVWGGARRRIVPSMLALALDGLAVVALGLIPEGAFPLAVTAVFCAGILETIVIGLNGAIGQAIIPPEMQGRVFSLMFSITQAFAPLGLLLAGPVADAFGVQVWYVLTGAIILAMGAGAFFVPAIMHIEERVAPLIPSGLAQTASKAQ